jgi:hypothetical protein
MGKDTNLLVSVLLTTSPFILQWFRTHDSVHDADCSHHRQLVLAPSSTVRKGRDPAKWFYLSPAVFP